MSATGVNLFTTTAAEQWRTLLPVDVSFWGSVEFNSILEGHLRRPAKLMSIQLDAGRVVLPFFVRPLSDLPFGGGHLSGADMFTPEFTGPFLFGGTVDFGCKQYLAKVGEVARELDVVAEFNHLHPWSCADRILDPTCIRFNREIVWVDLAIGVERLWSEHFTHACRKNINRAERENIRIFEAETSDHIRCFHEIYTALMMRRGAAGHYYFPLEFFLEIFFRLRDHARFTMAEHQGRIIGGVLYTHDRDNVYSYLGGTVADNGQIRPTNAIVFDCIRWAAAAGKKRLILGGGYCPNDGIFRFKQSFSKNTARFCTYKLVHNNLVYRELEQRWGRFYGQDCVKADYFPSYRSQPPDAAQERLAGCP